MTTKQMGCQPSAVCYHLPRDETFAQTCCQLEAKTPDPNCVACCLKHAAGNLMIHRHAIMEAPSRKGEQPTWKAKPMQVEYFRRRWTSISEAPPSMAPDTTEATSRAAVLCSWMYCRVSSPTVPLPPSLLMSTTCPATSPSAPTALPTSTTTCHDKNAKMTLG